MTLNNMLENEMKNLTPQELASYFIIFSKIKVIRDYVSSQDTRYQDIFKTFVENPKLISLRSANDYNFTV